jgi:hypothetical protein
MLLTRKQIFALLQLELPRRIEALRTRGGVNAAVELAEQVVSEAVVHLALHIQLTGFR